MLATAGTEAPTENPHEEVEYQVVHAIAGRIRIRIPQLAADSGYAGRLKQLVESLNFVTSVRINSLASSIVVHYTSAVSTAIQEHLSICIHQAGAAVGYTKPTSAIAPRPENHSATITDSNNLRSSLVEKTSEKLVSVPELVLPSTASVAAPPDAAGTDTPSSVELHLKQNDLAKRLGVATQALTHQRSKPNFSEWSIAKDPEGKAWIYAPATNSYHTDEPKPGKSQQSDAASNGKNGKVAREVPVVTSLEAAKTDTSSSLDLNLKQNDLAKRLGVATQALTHQRSKPNFSEWSMARDPEGESWTYAPATNSYYTDERQPRKSQQSDVPHSDKNGTAAREAEGGIALMADATISPAVTEEQIDQLDPLLSTAFTEATSPADANSDMPSAVKLHLKQNDLAKRLGVATQALTHQRSKPNFSEWSQERDPEGRAWSYASATNSYYIDERQPRESQQSDAAPSDENGKVAGAEAEGELALTADATTPPAVTEEQIDQLDPLLSTVSTEATLPDDGMLDLPSSVKLHLKQNDLAKRLRVATQGLTHQRSKPNFSEWSQEKDPEGRAWSYVPATNSYRTDERQPRKSKQSDAALSDKNGKVATEVEGELALAADAAIPPAVMEETNQIEPLPLTAHEAISPAVTEEQPKQIEPLLLTADGAISPAVIEEQVQIEPSLLTADEAISPAVIEEEEQVQPEILALTADEAISPAVTEEEQVQLETLPLTADEAISPTVTEEQVQLETLPLTADEAIPPAAVIEEQIDQLERSALADSTDPTSPAAKNDTLPLVKLHLKQNDLAKRLGVATQGLTHQRSKPKFGEWSQARDPEGRAWSYVPATNSYRTDERKARKAKRSSAASSDKNGNATREEAKGELDREGEVVRN